MGATLPVGTESLDDYLSIDNYISACDLRYFRISPRHYEHYHNNKHKQLEYKNSLVIDGAINCFLRDVSLFDELYTCAPSAKYKSGQESLSILEDTQLLYKNKAVIDKKIFDQITSSCKSLHYDKRIKSIFKDGDSNVSLYKVDERTGLKIKCRIPWLSTTTGILFDFKIYQGYHHSFINNYFSTGLYLDQVWNMQLLEKDSSAIVSIDSMASFEHRVELFDQDLIDKAQLEIRMLLDILFWCKKNNVYFDSIEFEEVKTKIYKYGMYDSLSNQGVHTVCQEIDKFMDKEIIKQEGWRSGYTMISMPMWMKK